MLNLKLNRAKIKNLQIGVKKISTKIIVMFNSKIFDIETRPSKYRFSPNKDKYL